MKKLILFLALVLSTSAIGAQTETHGFVRGGYSWINGVVGGELFVDYFSVGLGWMPNSSPLTGDPVTTICGQVSIHSNNTADESSVYLSIGFATNGYQVETSSSYGYSDYTSETMLIPMVGWRYYNGGLIDFKIGVGYGFYSGGGTWTGEVGLGIRCF